MQLILLHPEVAFRPCEDCQRYVYDHESGVREEFPPGSGNPVPRPAGLSPPCSQGPSACAKISPDAGVELNERNQEAYRHYLECRAVGSFPDDPIVREHAAIVRSIEDAAERMERKSSGMVMQAMLAAFGSGGSGLVNIDGV